MNQQYEYISHQQHIADLYLTIYLAKQIPIAQPSLNQFPNLTS